MLSAIPQSVLDRLAPDYRVFAEAQPPMMHIPLHTLQWSPIFRQGTGTLPDLGESPPVPVGSERTIQLGKFSVLALTPEGERPDEGWPVLLFIHGGGWVFGNAETGKSFYSRACVEAKCVVVSVDYRLAPEHPFPAAVDDCWEALLWLCGAGKDELGIDTSRIAVAGGSAGANLAAAVAQRASLATPRIPLVLQLLGVPPTNNTFLASDKSNWTPSMHEHQDIFSLRALDMMWCRDLYLPNAQDRFLPDASPLLQEDGRAYEGLAPAVVAIAELDVLKSEGEAYAERMKARGVNVTVKEYQGITHSGVAADRVCEVARTIRTDEIEALKAAFNH